jgi:NAD(P)H-hydrate repair Nnr-like enzyme with NAD(P)H-hydrate epimerase domain
VSSLRVLVFCGSGGGGGDSVVCASITIGNRQPTEVMPINPRQVWKCRWAKVGGCVCVWCKSRHEEEGGASDVEGEGSLLIVTGRKEPTKPRD